MGDDEGAVGGQPETHGRGGEDARIRELDGLRGAAIALVIALHVFVRPHMALWRSMLGPEIAQLIDMAWCGVDIFFVLSGFLIGGIILDRRGSSGFYPAFYARRATRIFPLYFALVAIAFMPLDGCGIHATTGTIPLIGYLTFTANLFSSAGAMPAFWLGPLWSICIEEQFYLLAPLVLRWTPARTIPWLLLLVIAGSAVLRSAIMLKMLESPMSPWDLTLTRLDGLGLGVLAAWLVRQPQIWHWVRSRPVVVSAAFSLLLAGSALFSQLPPALLLGPGILCLSATVFAAILLLRVERASWLSRPLRLRPLVVLGRYSYFLYLFHMPALWLTHGLLRQQAQPNEMSVIAVDGFAMIALCALAAASFRFFERPLLALGRRLPYGEKTPRTTAALHPFVR